MLNTKKTFYAINSVVALAMALALFSVDGLRMLIDPFTLIVVFVAGLALIGARAIMMKKFSNVAKVPQWLCFYFSAAVFSVWNAASGFPWYFAAIAFLYAALLCMAFVSIFSRKIAVNAV